MSSAAVQREFDTWRDLIVAYILVQPCPAMTYQVNTFLKAGYAALDKGRAAPTASSSIITLFSFLGIALGVATLIVIKRMMKNSHHELMDKILGVNGHAFVQAIETPFVDWEDVGGQNGQAQRRDGRRAHG